MSGFSRVVLAVGWATVGLTWFWAPGWNLLPTTVVVALLSVGSLATARHLGRAPSDRGHRCGPTCALPPPQEFPTGTRWSCPTCTAVYRRQGAVSERPWRNWYAPDGWWKFAGHHELRSKP